MTIRRLDQVVADAIAAGEVVERPASVVKELLENSIDSGASRIEILVEGAGSTVIRVTDDGEGIAPDDLPLMFVRHATSKVETLEDLDRVGSLGFRGEALASIAAVAEVDGSSTTLGAGVGAAIRARYGDVGAVSPAAPVPGTTIEVRGLFENTPARRSFLKKASTEVAAILRVVTGLGVANPGVAIRVSVDGRRALDLPGDGDAGRALAAAHPGLGPGALLPAAGRRGDFVVSGWVAEPAQLRRGRDAFYLSVNRRPVASRSIAFAVEQAYRGLVEPGLRPVGCLNIEAPLDRVDVNVHPTKREVRFRDDRAVFGLVQEAVLTALRASDTYQGSGLLSRPGWTAEAGGPPSLAERPAPGSTRGYPAAPIPGAAAVATLPGIEQRRLHRGPFRLVGQVLDSYILAEGPSGLVVVDQHAAHERVIFNRLQAGGTSRTWQSLLVPQLLQLSPVQDACLRDNLADLHAAGLEVEEFGPGAARLVAVDAALPRDRIDRLVLDVLDDLIGENPEVDLSRRLERATYTVACHTAVRFNQSLGREEMETLLRDLETAEPGITCPHGRPTLLEIGSAQLRREFKRS